MPSRKTEETQGAGYLNPLQRRVYTKPKRHSLPEGASRDRTLPGKARIRARRARYAAFLSKLGGRG